jgi:hypothetical protein
MPLADGVTALAAAVRTKINLMMPRLVPAGGTSGQFLAKTSGSDYAVGWSSGATVVINAQTGVSYTLALTDVGKLVTRSNGAVNTLTVPTNAAVAFPVGTVINVLMIGAGTTSVVGAAGVTVNGAVAKTGPILARWTGVTLFKKATNEWLAVGNVGPFV